MAIFIQQPACDYHVDYTLRYKSNTEEVPKFAWLWELDSSTPTQSGTIVLQVNATDYENGDERIDYEEGDYTIELVGTTNDSLQPDEDI